jgi:hypothetical protein
MPKRSPPTLGFSLYTFVEFLVLFIAITPHVWSIICVIDRSIIHDPTTSFTLTVPAAGPRISLRPLGPSIPPHMYFSTLVAYVWAQPPTTKPNMMTLLVSSSRPVTATFFTLAFYKILNLSSYNSTTYIVLMILVSFSNTYKLYSYITTLIPSHLHIFQDTSIK